MNQNAMEKPCLENTKKKKKKKEPHIGLDLGESSEQDRPRRTQEGDLAGMGLRWLGACLVCVRLGFHSSAALMSAPRSGGSEFHS